VNGTTEQEFNTGSRNIWKPRIPLKPGSKNILRKSLVDPKKILLPPLHIKLGIMKQFVKAFPEFGHYFKYLCNFFFHFSEAKIKKGFFIAPDIGKLIFD
jgi:hypothetical protein